jgi:hypothetical protein
VSRPRRTRYRIETHRGPVDVLAYSPEGARNAAERAGYSIVTGPRPARKRTIQGEARWTVDDRALRAACRALGVEWDVRVTRTKAQRTNGVHRLRVRNGRPVHYITGPALADTAKATATLWHELTHAAQAERAARDAGVHHDPSLANLAWCRFVRRQQRYPYSVRPIEVEARATAENPPLPIPLVAPA